jgi:hypothetical protein
VTAYEGDLPTVHGLPDELYLILCRGEWPVRAAVCEGHVFDTVAALQEELPTRVVLVYRVDTASLTQVEVRTEIVRQALVPRGGAL